MPERFQGSRSSSEEQWSVVDHKNAWTSGHQHQYEVVTLRSNLGRYSRGFRCRECGGLEVVSERQWRGHGQRVERSAD
jgi:hypothetical protein